MTACTDLLELFTQKIDGKKRRVTMRSSEEDLSSNGGALVLRMLDQQLGLSRMMAKALDDPRDPERITYDLATLVLQRVLQIGLGYEDCNDGDKLCHDPALLTALELWDNGRSGSQPTLSRVEERCTEDDLSRLFTVWVEQWLDRLKASGRRELTLDFDPTDDEVHGHQQLSLWNSYYDERCFLHFLVIDSVSGDIVTPILLPGTMYAGKVAVPVLHKLIALIRRRIPGIHITVRMDAGFACPELFACCEELRLQYLIALAGNAVLHRLTAADHAAVSREGGRRYCEFLYQSETWDHPRHVIASTFQRGTETIRQHFVVTNIPIAEEQLYTWYCHRAEGIENRIKEWKGHIAADRTSCHGYYANHFRLFLHAAAYTLCKELHRRLARTDLATATIETLRLHLLKVACRIKITHRRIWIALTKHAPALEYYRIAMNSA
jgi:hypothetical protein